MCSAGARWGVGDPPPSPVVLSRGEAGWVARVRRAGWDGLELVVDGPLFPAEGDAIAWCRRMAEVLRRDLEDDEDDGGPLP